MKEVLTGLAYAIGNVFLAMGNVVFEFFKAVYENIKEYF